MTLTKNTRLLIVFAVLLAATLAVVFSRGKSTSAWREERLSVGDTASVALVSIRSAQGDGVELQRIDGQWFVDGQAPARTELLPPLMKVVHDIAKTKPVAKADTKKMIADIDRNGLTITIESRRKTMARYRVLFAANGECFAQPDGSDRVFAVEVPGYSQLIGVLRLASPADWKSRTVFAVKPDRVQQIILNNLRHPERSFAITRNGRQMDVLSYPIGLKMNNVDAEKVQRYVGEFARKNFADYAQLQQPQIDSITATQPLYTLTVATTDGREQWCRAFVRHLPNGTPDPDNFYLLLSSSDFVVARYYDFDPVVRSLEWFGE